MKRIEWRTDNMANDDICAACYALHGTPHDYMCDMERCMICGHQRISCDCEREHSNEIDIENNLPIQ